MKNVFLALIVCSALLAQYRIPPRAPSGAVHKIAPSPAAKTAPAATKSIAKKPPAPKPNLLEPQTMRAKAPAVFRARLNTTRGPVTIEVTRAWSPNGADRFYNLVRAGYFTDLYFFRVVAGFMAQFGLHSSPEVSQVWLDQTMEDEPVKQSNTRGMVTFAKSSMPNSRSTQIFINYGDNSRLDASGFAPFGKVVRGMEIVDALYSGYGEQSNDQGSIRAQGKPFFEANFPQLDKITTAVIVPIVPVVRTTATPAQLAPAHPAAPHPAAPVHPAPAKK